MTSSWLSGIVEARRWITGFLISGNRAKSAPLHKAICTTLFFIRAGPFPEAIWAVAYKISRKLGFSRLRFTYGISYWNWQGYSSAAKTHAKYQSDRIILRNSLVPRDFAIIRENSSPRLCETGEGVPEGAAHIYPWAHISACPAGE